MTSLMARRAAGFAIALLGMLGIAAWYVDTSWCWFLWLGLGLAAGVVVGRGRDVWLVALAGVAFYPIATWLGMPGPEVKLRDAWVVVTALGAVLVGSAFVLGTLVWWRPGRSPAVRASASTHPAGGGLVVLAVGLALLALAGWIAFSGLVGAEKLTRPAAADKWLGCDTPASYFGMTYEPINYDPADDVRLLAANPDRSHCASQGHAGSQVLSSDGTPIAGWYLPAANGMGPTGPTFVVAPGWKSNKTEILKYVPPLHQDYNLVLVDLRNGGRSGGDRTTWGYLERDDVRAMIDWLERTKAPTWIGATGNSMGAATVLAEAVDDPRVRALILDSMHASVVTTFGDGIEFEEHLPGYPTADAAVAMSSGQLGVDITEVDPVRMIARLGDRPVLLLHGTADGLDRPEHSADRNAAAATAAGVPVVLRYCVGAGHGRVVDACPVEWAAWAEAFLDPIVPAAAR